MEASRSLGAGQAPAGHVTFESVLDVHLVSHNFLTWHPSDVEGAGGAVLREGLRHQHGSFCM